MRIDWISIGNPRQSKRGRYTVEVPDAPIGTWATDQFSVFYERLEEAFTREAPRARSAVMARSRVDTGLMRAMVDAFTALGHTELVLDFGWWGGLAEGGTGPFYAPFQEFGTSNGVTPMRAVQRTFHEAVANIRGSM